MKLFLFLFFLSFTYNQHNHDDHDHDHDHSHSHSSGSIVGTVINANTGQPIEYASVSLINQTSNQADVGQLTLLDGRFILSGFHKGTYKVSISFMGFKDWSSDPITISDHNIQKDMGTIALTIKSLETEDVNIIEEKEVYEFKADKLVYNPSEDIIASSGSAEDVLTQAPMVSVDQDGEVSLRGNSNVNILVDGRTKRIDLGSIAASQIEKVEVITSPSAKYDPEGMAGIINIVLKKGSNDGFNGILKFNGRHNKYYSIDKMNGLNFNGNYRKQKLNLFSSFALNSKYSNRSGHRNSITTFYSDLADLPDLIDSVFYSYTDDKERLFYNFKIGADYYINDFLTISSQLKADHHTKKSTTEQAFTAPFNYTETSIEQDDSDNPNLDIEYLFVLDREYIDPDQALSFSINFHKGDDAENAILIENTTQKITSFDALHSAIDIDFFYKYPLDKNSKIEFGYDGRIIDNSNLMSLLESVLFSEEANINNDNTDTMIKNEFLFKRNLHGFFLEYENQLSKSFSIKPSLRLEKLNRNVSFNTNFIAIDLDDSVFDNLFNDAAGQSYDLDTLEIYPYLNMTYNIDKNENLQFGFGRRVERPGGAHGSWQVRPFPTNIYNEQFLFVGNPYLAPEYSNQYDLNYSRPIPMGFASLSLFYHDIENKIEWYDDDSYGDVGDVLTFRNVDEAQSVGISFFGMIMGQSLGGSYTKTNQSDNDSPDDYELNESSEMINLFGKIRFPEEFIKIFDFEFGFYWMKMILPSGEMWGNNGTTWADLGISKKLMNDRLTASFTIDNIFDSGGFQMKRTKPLDYAPVNYSNGEEFTDVFNTRNGRTFKFTLKFDLGKKVDGRKKKFDKGHSHSGGGNMDMGY